MVILWRKFVSWLRLLLLKIYRKKVIKWDEEVIKLIKIIKEIEKKEIEKKDIPKYNIIGKIRRFKLFRRRQ